MARANPLKKSVVYKGCKLSIYHPDRPADLDIDCIVVISQGSIELKYDQDDGQFWSWKGPEQGEGHYVVNANQENLGARGTLHRLRDGFYLEGYWAEGGFRGMWRVTLGNADA